MRPVTVEFTVTAALGENGLLRCTWVCTRCGAEVNDRVVRAHLIGHAHEDIGVAS